MRIIKKGKLPEKLEHEVECKYCNTIFKFKNCEARCNSYRNEFYLTVRCPICDQSVVKEI